jgi:hypothetical protein
MSRVSKQLCVYADYILMTARTKQTLNETFTKLNEEAEKLPLLININKTTRIQKE